MSVLKTAVIGLGRIGWQCHIPAIQEHEGFELTAVLDPLPERLEEAKAEFGVEKLYTDFTTLIEEAGVDAIVIASPTAFHKDQAIAAMAKGIKVFCDKPMALDLAECDEMIAAKNKYDGKLMIFQPHRVTPEIVGIRDIIEQGLLGEVFMVKRAWNGYVRRNDWQAWRKNGGGMLYNYGAHIVDQMLYLTGSPYSKIDCTLRSLLTLGDADDIVKLVLESESGVIVDVDINMAAALPVTNFQVFGKNGTALLDMAKNAWVVRYVKEDEIPEASLQEGLAASGRNYCGENITWHDAEFPLSEVTAPKFYDKVYDYFVNDAEPFIPVEQTREVMRTLGECLKIAEAKNA